MDEDEHIYELRKALTDAQHSVCTKYCPNSWKEGRPQPHHHFCKSITKVLAGKFYEVMCKPSNSPTPEEKLHIAIFGATEKEQRP
jgi:hypothetical protein